MLASGCGHQAEYLLDSDSDEGRANVTGKPTRRLAKLGMQRSLFLLVALPQVHNLRLFGLLPVASRVEVELTATKKRNGESRSPFRLLPEVVSVYSTRLKSTLRTIPLSFFPGSLRSNVSTYRPG